MRTCELPVVLVWRQGHKVTAEGASGLTDDKLPAPVKTSLSHLPARKQQQLADVVATLCEIAPVEMVILFGSHARGDWVDDPVGGYHSDFDVLVVVKSRKTAENHNIWNTIEERLRKRLGNTELSLIVHDIKDVTNQLEKGFYFFSDVKNEGIVLYDSQRFALAKEKGRSPEERLEQARVWFADWFQAADEFLSSFEESFAKGHWKTAAFQLHQATERYYNTTQLVFTAYKAKLHNIEELGRRVLNLHSGFAGVFPRETKDDDALFKQLKNAYIDARYSNTYEITPDELAILKTRVLDLRERTDRICKERLNLPPSPVKELQLSALAIGEAKGRTAGKVEGEAKGTAKGVLGILQARGLDVPAEVRDRILGCTDLTLLDAWFKRALGVRASREIFDESSNPKV